MSASSEWRSSRSALIALAMPALSAAGRNTTDVEAKLKGKYEVPGPGVDRRARAQIEVVAEADEVRSSASTSPSKRLDPMTAGHIHKGAEGEAGKVKVMLFEDPQGLDGAGSYEGCVKNVKTKLLKKMAARAGEAST